MINGMLLSILHPFSVSNILTKPSHWFRRAAGRYATGKTFEETVLARLDAIGRDLRQVKDDVREVKTTLADACKIR